MQLQFGRRDVINQYNGCMSIMSCGARNQSTDKAHDLVAAQMVAVRDA